MQRRTEKRGPGGLGTDLPAPLRTCIHSCPQVCERSWFLSLFLKNNSFTLFMAVMGLPCCMRASSTCGEWGLLFIAVDDLLFEMASLVSEQALRVHRLRWLCCTGSVVAAHRLSRAASVVAAHGLSRAASVVAAHRLSCSSACGIFPDQGSNPCPLHQQVDSYPLNYQRDPVSNL